MNTAMPIQQRGLGFGEFLLGAFLFVLLALFGFRLIPAYMQEAKIKNIFASIAHDPEMQKASIHDIKVSFEKQTSIDSITAIKPDDVEITNENGRPVLSAKYAVKVPLAGNISLYLEFNPSSAGK